MCRALLPLCLVAILLSGCGSLGKARTTGTGTATATAGNTSAEYYLTEGGMLLVIWIKHPHQGSHASGSGISSSATRTVVTGNYRRFDQPPLEWRCETEDGRSGNVSLGGATYELSSGRIFLVDMQGEKPVVTQLGHDLSGVKTKAELELMAVTDPEIAKFVNETAEATGKKEKE